MGRDGNIACLDCKISYSLGYGSYRGWLDYCKTPEELEEAVRKFKIDSKFYGDMPLGKHNENALVVLTEHRGHRLQQWSGDWAEEVDGHLDIIDGYGDGHLIEDFGSFQKIEMED